MTDARIAGAAKPPFIALDLATPRVRRRDHGDGGFILESEEPLGPYADHAGLLLQGHAEARPDAVFIAERNAAAADGWRRITYGEAWAAARRVRSEEHTSELQSLMRISYAVFCLKTK